MYTIRKVIRFEAAHVLDSSYSRACQYIHGHSYIVELFFQSEMLNYDGMVVDFGLVKERTAKLFADFDHSMIATDKGMPSTVANIKPRLVSYNPTAENMAKDFYTWIKERIPQLSKVRIHETSTGWAEYEE